MSTYVRQGLTCERCAGVAGIVFVAAVAAESSWASASDSRMERRLLPRWQGIVALSFGLVLDGIGFILFLSLRAREQRGATSNSKPTSVGLVAGGPVALVDHA
jgi:Kef-type K+ transport system membrane component KefB